MKCRSCGCEMGVGDLYCPGCGLKRETVPHETEPKTETYGMAWYKFLIYVSLFLTAFVDIASGIYQIMGGYYMAFSDSVYARFPALRPVDVITGAVMIVLGAFAVYTRYRLSGFRQNGPICLYFLYGGDLLISLSYVTSASIIIGRSAVTVSMVAQTVVGMILLGLNVMYFSRRERLFVNP